MKKVFAITLALLMVAFALAACVSNGTAETESQTVAETERDTEAATESQTTAATESETNAVTETESETETETQTETETETEPPIPDAGLNSGVVRDGTPKKYFTLRLDDCTTQDGRIIEIFTL